MMAMYWAFVILTLAVVGHQSQADSRTPRKPRQTESDRPNIIMILADDMGYGDIASYGHPTQEYGPVDVMAENGLRFTQAYSSDSVCSPSRAALLTGKLSLNVRQHVALHLRFHSIVLYGISFGFHVIHSTK